MPTQVNENTLIVGPCRLSYLNAFKPKKNDTNDKVEFSAVLMFPKMPGDKCKDPQGELKAIAAMVKSAMLYKFGNNPPKVWRNPLQDGDKELSTSTGEPKYPGYWYMNVKAGVDYPPVLVNGKLQPVTSGWNSGDWGKVKVSFYGYDQAGNKGVGAGLHGIQFLFKDESFGGGGPSAEGFAEEEGDEPATAPMAEDQGWDPFSDE